MKILWRIIIVLLVLAGLVAICNLVATAIVASREQAEDKEWAATLLPIESIGERFPPAPANETALTLEKMAAAMGINLVARDQLTRPHPDDKAEKAYTETYKDLQTYLNAQLQVPGNRIDPPPAAFTTFMAEHGPAVAELRAYLLKHTAPHWAMDISQLFYAPLELDFAGMLKLSRLLAIDALARQLGHDQRTAGDDLDAIGKLGNALEDRPEMLNQMLASVLDGLLLGTLRKIDDLPATWPPRVTALDRRKGFLTSAELEAWSTDQFTRNGVPGHSNADIAKAMAGVTGGDSSTPIWIMLAPVIRPYFRYSAVDISARTRAVVASLQQQDPCTFDIAAFQQNEAFKPASWNLLGQMAMPSFGAAWRRIARQTLDGELTVRVLQAKQLRQDSLDGNWPAQLPGSDQSVCKGQRWIYKADPVGHMSITFSGKVPEDKNAQVKPLPLEYSQDLPAPAGKGKPVKTGA